MKATLKQVNTLKTLVENRGISLGQAMRVNGYAEKTAKNPKNLTESKGWKELLMEISDEPILQRVMEIAMDKGDKRSSLTAIDMLWKLKDKYPAGKLKMTAYQEETGKYLDE